MLIGFPAIYQLHVHKVEPFCICVFQIEDCFERQSKTRNPESYVALICVQMTLIFVRINASGTVWYAVNYLVTLLEVW